MQKLLLTSTIRRDLLKDVKSVVLLQLYIFFLLWNIKQYYVCGTRSDKRILDCMSNVKTTYNFHHLSRVIERCEIGRFALINFFSVL